MRDGDRVADRVAVYQPEFLDFQHWVETHRRTAKRPLELVRAILKDPFDGIGKPESLKYLGADVCPDASRKSTVACTWSRSIASSFCKAATTIEFWAEKTVSHWLSRFYY